MDKLAIDLQYYIDSVKAKLKIEDCNINDYDKCINVLSKTVNPRYCIFIYENYINY